MTRNFPKVFRVFGNKYKLVPLEVFGSNPYTTLISTLLSSRTKDEVTLQASKKLFAMAPTIAKLGQLSQQEIMNLIYPVGFYKTKAKQLKLLTNLISTNFRGTIPNTRSQLLTLPGVGIKTANLVLNRAFNTPAIAVDTHVHRISNLLGWVNTRNPEQTEKRLKRILPKKYWGQTNRFFVSIGRQFRSKNKLVDFLKKQGLTS